MKCKYCGKNISKNKNFWITINNDGSLQGMEDQIFFCNKNCFTPWKTNYLRQKSKQKKVSYKANLLENPTRKASDDDLLGIFKTLSKTQKDEMLLHMFAICYAKSDKTVGGIIAEIDSLKKLRKEHKTFEISDF